MRFRWVSGECQVNVKSQSERDIGGRETCFIYSSLWGLWNFLIIHSTLPFITTKITKIPFTWCLLQFSHFSLVHSLPENWVQRQTPSTYCEQRPCQSPEPGPYLISGVPCLRFFVTVSVRGSASLESSVHLVSWRVRAVTFQFIPFMWLDLYIVSEIWKYCFYRQHHNYLYTCLY